MNEFVRRSKMAHKLLFLYTLMVCGAGRAWLIGGDDTLCEPDLDSAEAAAVRRSSRHFAQ
jgi:hypothetical protein